MLSIGHRGARGHEPENTLRSVHRAIELGADWVEIDVYAVEGELVVIHDDRLERTTNGTGYVIDQTIDHLRSLDAGKGERIPLLREVFDVAEGMVGINVELKGAHAESVLAEFLRGQLESSWPADQLLVSSFNHRALARFRSLLPDVPIGALIVGLPVTNAAFAEALGARSVHPSIDFIDREFVDDAHARGLAVLPFTANHPEDLQRMAALGVDGVFSDYPERVANT